MLAAAASIEDIDLIELDEAFAAQVVACERELGFDLARLDVNGGAIALGHPIGAPEARIVVTLAHELKKRSTRRSAARPSASAAGWVSLCC